MDAWLEGFSDVHSVCPKTFKAYGLSARAFTRILKVARTIADLEGAESIGERHLAEAIQYRVLDLTFSLPSNVRP